MHRGFGVEANLKIALNLVQKELMKVPLTKNRTKRKQLFSTQCIVDNTVKIVTV